MTLPDPKKVSKTTKDSQKRIAQEKEAERKAAEAKLAADTKMELAHWRKILTEDIEKAAEEGYTQVSLCPMGGVSAAGERAFWALQKELLEAGYTVHIRHGHYSPVGSDDLPSHDWTELKVSWE